jgi:hypothetical protein
MVVGETSEGTGIGVSVPLLELTSYAAIMFGVA